MSEEHPINQKIICQSCGMPMKKDKDFGTNPDRSFNLGYCSFCFRNGRFTDEGISLKDKIDRLVKISVEQLGLREELARNMAETKLPQLKRWRK